MWYGCTVAPGDPPFGAASRDSGSTTHVDLYDERWRKHSCNIAVLNPPNSLPSKGRD
jgi:hypothetical protein